MIDPRQTKWLVPWELVIFEALGALSAEPSALNTQGVSCFVWGKSRHADALELVMDLLLSVYGYTKR
jgi:hypothetical protein